MRVLCCILLALVGCVTSSEKVCGDGSICPRGFECDDEHHRCLQPAQLAACSGAGVADDLPCSVDGAPGTCRFGACDLWFCGDGVQEGTEQCDGQDLGKDLDRNGVTSDCITVGFYGSAGLACDQNCRYDTRACTGGRCGDQIVNGQETCDGDTLATCIAIGFDAGSVNCDQLCSFSIINCSRFGWNPEPLTDIVGFAVSGTAHDDQWVVGLGGKAAHFDGLFWIAEPTPVTANLTAAWSIARGDVWAIGLSSTVIHYGPIVDANKNAWSVVNGVPAGNYVDVWAASPSAVFIATSDAGILMYDGGNWTTMPTVVGTPIAIRGTAADDIWVATDEGPLQHWNGTTWTAQSPPNTSVRFIDANRPGDVWVVGHQNGNDGTGVIAHLDGVPGSGTWTTFVRPQLIFNNIASSAPNDAWVAGVDGVMRHYDGVAWSESSNVALPGGLTGVSGFLSFGPDEVVAVSTLRLAYRYRGQTFGQFKSLGSDPFTAPDNLAFWGPAANDLWMTNARKEIFHFDGVDWSLELTASDISRAVFGFATDDVWFAVNDGSVLHYNGVNFTTESVAGVPIQKLFGSGSTDIWAFSPGLAFHRDGPTWTPFPLSTGKNVLSVSGTSASDVWAVLEGNLLFHWNGTAWSEDTTIDSVTPLLAVAAVSATDAHVTAIDGQMFHWDGTSWKFLTQVASIGQLGVITATAEDDVIAASQFDAFHYDGKLWSPMRLPDELQNPGFPTVRAIQASPGRIDMMLDRFRILTLIRTRPLNCRGSEAAGAACNDGVDNDCDGVLDTNDNDCP